MQRRRPRLAPLLPLAALAIAGCGLVGPSDGQKRSFHNTRWDLLVESRARHQAPPAMPDRPALKAEGYEQLPTQYSDIADTLRAEQQSWDALLLRSEESAQFCAELLDVLESRNVSGLGKLGAQVSAVEQAQSEALSAWQGEKAQRERLIGELQQSWTALWPENDLSFTLEEDAKALLVAESEEPDEVRGEALRNFHRNEYDRLAQTYLGYEPEKEAFPTSHIPEGASELAYSLRRLEALLLVRYSLDRAIEKDFGQVTSISPGKDGRIDWQKLNLPRDEYSRGRLETSVARLKLLKVLDGILSQGMQPVQAEVERQWLLLWPQHALETNVFAHAGLGRD